MITELPELEQNKTWYAGIVLYSVAMPFCITSVILSFSFKRLEYDIICIFALEDPDFGFKDQNDCMYGILDEDAINYTVEAAGWKFDFYFF
jgi:hypothetical protein